MFPSALPFHLARVPSYETSDIVYQTHKQTHSLWIQWLLKDRQRRGIDSDILQGSHCHAIKYSLTSSLTGIFLTKHVKLTFIQFFFSSVDMFRCPITLPSICPSEFCLRWSIGKLVFWLVHWLVGKYDCSIWMASWLLITLV